MDKYGTREYWDKEIQESQREKDVWLIALKSMMGDDWVDPYFRDYTIDKISALNAFIKWKREQYDQAVREGK